MAEALPEQGSFYGQDCLVAGALAGKLRIEEYRAAEENYEQEESHTGDENQAGGVHIVVIYASGVRVGAGSRCVLAGAAAGTVALAELVGFADTAALSEFFAAAVTAEWAGIAEIVGTAVPGIVGFADTAAIAGIVGPVSIVEIVDTAEASADTVDTAAATERQPSLSTIILSLASTTNKKWEACLRP